MDRVSNRTLIAPRLVAVAAAVALAGCGGHAVVARPPATVTVSVTPSPTCNRGRPLHALVRTVTLKQFVEEPDRNVADLVVSPDDSVVAAFVVFPGIAQSIAIDRPARGALAVYFLFTGATGTSWKQLFDGAPSTIRLELGDNQIQASSTSPPLGARSPRRAKPRRRRAAGVGSGRVATRRDRSGVRRSIRCQHRRGPGAGGA